MYDSLFLCYAKHQTELDAIVDAICGGPSSGSVNLAAADDLSKNDLEYITGQLRNRGYACRLFLQED